MKKVKSYYLSVDVIHQIEERSAFDDRGASDWLNLYLTKQLVSSSPIVQVRKTKPKTSSDSEGFELVWLIYEKKGNKKTSKAKFSKLKDSDKLLMSEHIGAYVKSTPDKQYRKNLETYINQECWNDEVIVNEKSNEKRIETTSDRYARQSRELQEREGAATRNNQDTALIHSDGQLIR